MYNEKISSPTRLSYIDTLKGFIMLCVVAVHAINGVHEAVIDADISLLLPVYRSIHSFAMPLFVIINGFMFEKAYFYHIDHCEAVSKKRLKLQILNLLRIFIEPASLFWYIYTLVFLYMIFSIPTIRDIPVNWLLPILVAINIVGGKLLYNFNFFSLQSICDFSIFFFIGALRCRKPDMILFRTGTILIFGAIATGFSILWWNDDRMLNSITGVSLVAGLGFSLLIMFLFKKFELLSSNKLLSICGKYSLQVYLLHSFFVSGTRTLLLKLSIHNQYMIVFLCTAIGLSVPIVIGFVCNKLNLDFFFKPATFISKKLNR